MIIIPIIAAFQGTIISYIIYMAEIISNNNSLVLSKFISGEQWTKMQETIKKSG